MKRLQSNRVLALALAFSIVIHGVVALFARYHRVEAAPEPPPQHVTIATIPKPTPPPPTPKPTEQPRKPSSEKPRPTDTHVKPPTVTSTAPPDAGPRVAVASPGPQATNDPGPSGPGDATASPAPTASPTPKPQCSTPYEAAHAVTAVEPAIPDGAAGTNATVQVQVTLSASGSVLAATVFRSADNFELDRAAVSAARASKYAAEVRDCKPVGGTYLFTATFQD